MLIQRPTFSVQAQRKYVVLTSSARWRYTLYVNIAAISPSVKNYFSWFLFDLLDGAVSATLIIFLVKRNQEVLTN